MDLPDHRPTLRDIFRWIVTARCVDIVEEEYAARGEAFFQVSSSGHEGSAVLQRHLTADDWLHCHYRDKALMLARGITAEDFFNSLFCNAASHSAGRQMSAHMSDASRHVLSIVGPVGNHALQAVGVAHEVKHRPGRPIVLCSMGDGTSQEGEVLEAIAEAVRWELPVLFWIEDNGYSISTATRGKTFFSQPAGDIDEFYGIKLDRIDGRNLVDCDQSVEQIVAKMRQTRQPAIVICRVERLMSHTNADDETIYRTPQELSRALHAGDPIASHLDELPALGMTREEVDDLLHRTLDEVREVAARASLREDPIAELSAKRVAPPSLLGAASETQGPSRRSRRTRRGKCGGRKFLRAHRDLREKQFKPPAAGGTVECPFGRRLARGHQCRACREVFRAIR